MKPHILVLILDAARYDALALAGGVSAMPGLQRLAGQSRVYTRAYCNAPWTLPSHASIFSGLPASRHGATQQTLQMRADVPHLAEILHEQAGYRTYLFAANDWFAAETGLARGFEHLVGNPVHHGRPLQRRWRNLKAKLRRRLQAEARWSVSQRLVAAMLATLDEAVSARQPHFLFANLMDAHLPLRPSRDAAARFFDDPAEAEQARRLALPVVEHRHVAGRRRLDARELSLLRRLYRAALYDLDTTLAPLLDRLQQPHLRGRILLVVAADHGEHLGEHGLIGHQFSVYQPLVRVPLLIHRDGEIDAAIIDTPVQLSDLFPTLLRQAGLSPSAFGSNAGRDLLDDGLLSAREDRAIFVEYARPAMSIATLRRHHPHPDHLTRLDRGLTAVVAGDYKYILAEGNEREEYLFALNTDPGERVNLATAAPPELAHLRELLLHRREQNPSQTAGPFAVHEMDAAVRRRLQELGYL